jgi:hypothetical protein
MLRTIKRGGARGEQGVNSEFDGGRDMFGQLALCRRWIQAIVFCVVGATAVAVAFQAVAGIENQFVSSDVSGPFVVLGNLSGEVLLFPILEDSIGSGSLVHTFQDAMASGLTIIDHGADGDLDIVALVQWKDLGGTPTGESDVYLFENNGSGFDISYIPDTIPMSGGFWFPMSDICSEDFFKDGYDDFVVSITGDSRTVHHLFVYDPLSGMFSESFLDDSPWASHAWLLDGGDVQNDSYADFVTFDYPNTSDFADEVFLYKGDGLGGFSTSFACSTIHSVNDIAVGDFNNDGCADFAAGVDDDGNPGAVWLFLGDNTGTFSLISETPVFDLDPVHNSGQDRTGTGHMDAYDVDQDGNLDLIAYVHGRNQEPFDPSLWLIPGNGDGSFQDPIRVCHAIGDLSLPLALSTPLRFEPVLAELSVDIKPRSCPNPVNTRSQGVLPVAVLGKSNFDVTLIDVSSVLLEGVAAIRSGIEDVSRPVGESTLGSPDMTLRRTASDTEESDRPVQDVFHRPDGDLQEAALAEPDQCECTTDGPDGYDDLTLKFDTQEIVAAVGDVEDRDTLVLTLTANLSDGTELKGQDCIIVLKNEGGRDHHVPQSSLELPGQRPFALYQSSPNPFRSSTTVTFLLEEAGHTRLTVCDLAGRVVATLVDGELAAGVGG